VRARACVVAERDAGGRSRCTTLRSAPPLSLRTTIDGLHVVGSAAGPVGGDDIGMEVFVRAGASLTVRSAAAQLVLPGPAGAPSASRVDAVVEAGGSLEWLPEPIVAVRGADHCATTSLTLDAGCDVTWREEVVLGRHQEAPGSVRLRLRVERGGELLVHNELGLGPLWPEWNGPAGCGAARVVSSVLVTGPRARELAASAELPPAPGTTGAVFALTPDAIAIIVLADRLDDARALLSECCVRR
jgi:urease accessory protein